MAAERYDAAAASATLICAKLPTVALLLTSLIAACAAPYNARVLGAFKSARQERPWRRH